MTIEEFVNMLDDLRCGIERLNDNLERFLQSSAFANREDA